MSRILLIALLFYLIIWVVRGLLSPSRGKGTVARTDTEKELVRDAYSGVYFVKTEAVSISTGGETLYFSTLANRDAWLLQNSRQQ